LEFLVCPDQDVSEIMADNGQLVSRQAVSNEMEIARRTFHRLLDHMSPVDLRRPTRGTKWNNEELLFHMLFGYLIALSLIPLVKLSGRLPPKFSRLFAMLLNSVTGPFNTVNYLGSRLGAKVYNHRRMGVKFDKATESLRRRLSRENESSLRRGMHFPTRWDPFFKDYMTVADLYHYPTQHFTFHSGQLNLGPDQDG
jgi:hypothetical protein